jgi:RHS repeat-associated protein
MPTTKYIWDGDNLLAEADATNTINVVYTNEPQPYGKLISTRIGNNTSYHHYDALGSTRQLTNAAGTVTDTMTYDAWGNIISRTGTTAISLLWIGELGYYSDSEIGMSQLRRRHLDPVQGRFTSEDPLEQASELNRYRYVQNRPTLFVDPSGMDIDFWLNVAYCVFWKMQGVTPAACTARPQPTGGSTGAGGSTAAKGDDAEAAWKIASIGNCNGEPMFICGLKCLTDAVKRNHPQGIAATAVLGNISDFSQGRGNYDMRCDPISKKGAAAATGQLQRTSGGSASARGWTLIPTNPNYNTCGDVALMLLGELYREGGLTIEHPRGGGSIDENIAELKKLRLWLCQFPGKDTPCRPKGAWYHPERREVVLDDCWDLYIQ